MARPAMTVSGACETRREPGELKWITRFAQIIDDVAKIRLAKVRQHPAVVNIRAPAHETVVVRLAPKLRDQPAQQEMLCQTHACVRRHFKSAHLDKTEATGAAFRR